MSKVTNVLDLSDQSEKSAIHFLKSSFGLGLREDGELVVVFRTNDGKGSGQQMIPLNEAADAIVALEEAYYNGNQAERPADYIPAPQMITRTFGRAEVKSGDDTIDAFRWNPRSGKGAKPATVPVDEMEAFLPKLRAKVTEMLQKAAAHEDIEYNGPTEIPVVERAQAEDIGEVS